MMFNIGTIYCLVLFIYTAVYAANQPKLFSTLLFSIRVYTICINLICNQRASHTKVDKVRNKKIAFTKSVENGIVLPYACF